MLPSRFHCGLLLAAAALALASNPAACALDRVTLRNGFSYDCTHHEPLADGRVRLFLSDGADSNYIDLPAAAIDSVATLPDPSVTPATTASANADVRSLLSRAGEEHNIDVDLLASIVHAESNGHTNAVSRTGAQGLMQLMPGTARDLGVKDSFQPDQNINGGTAYLDALLKRYRDNLDLALAAYNAGPAAVDKYHAIPPYRETEAYVRRVKAEFMRRSKLRSASQPSVQTASAAAPR